MPRVHRNLTVIHCFEVLHLLRAHRVYPVWYFLRLIVVANVYAFWNFVYNLWIVFLVWHLHRSQSIRYHFRLLVPVEPVMVVVLWSYEISFLRLLQVLSSSGGLGCLHLLSDNLILINVRIVDFRNRLVPLGWLLFGVTGFRHVLEHAHFFDAFVAHSWSLSLGWISRLFVHLGNLVLDVLVIVQNFLIVVFRILNNLLKVLGVGCVSGVALLALVKLLSWSEERMISWLPLPVERDLLDGEVLFDLGNLLRDD